MPRPSDHPQRQVLEGYSLGCLEDREMNLIEAHLAGCVTCSALADETRDDDFCRLLRKHGSEMWEPTNSFAGKPQKNVAGLADLPSAMETQRRLEEMRRAFTDQTSLRLGPVLDQGGMGIVFEATHEKTRQLVAVKTIRPDLLDSPNLAARFNKEIRTSAHVVDPHVVRVQDAGDLTLSDGTLVPFSVMEFVDGERLDEHLRRYGPLDGRIAVSMFRQMVLALKAMFRQNVVHRDIKPQNFRVTPAGIVKLLDFGLAREDDPRNTVLTSTEHFLGTVDYLSPEQASNPHCADVRSDIYSLGCTFYFALVGQPPFPHVNKVEAIKAHDRTPPSRIHELRPEIHRLLSDLVDRMLAKSPDQRFQTPDEIMSALEAVDRELACADDSDDSASFDSQAAVPSGPRTNRNSGKAVTTVADRIKVPRRSRAFSAKWIFGAAVVGIALLFGVTLILDTGHGRLIVECPDPTVAVQIERDDRAVPGLEMESTTSDQRTYRISAGKIRVTLAADQRDCFEVVDQTVTIFRGKDVRVRIRLKPSVSTTIADGRGGQTVVPVASGELEGPPNWKVPQPPRPVDFGWSLVPKTFAGSVSAAEWSPDGEFLAIATSTGDCRIFRGETLEVVSYLDGHKDAIHGIAWCDDGQRLATGSDDHTIRIWSPAGKLQALIQREGVVLNLAWQPHGTKLACVENSGPPGAIGRGALFDALGNELALFPIDRFYASALAWSANGRRLATSGSEPTVRFWTEHGKADGAWDRDAPAGGIHWNVGGVLAASGGNLKSFDVRPAAGDRWLRIPLPNKPGNKLRWSPDAKWILVPVANEAFLAQVQAPADGEAKIAYSTLLKDDFSAVAWHPNSRRFATAGKSIRIWRLPDGNEIEPVVERFIVAPPVASVHRVAWHPKRDEFAVATDHGTVLLRDDRNRRVSEIKAHIGPVSSLAWSPDGEWLATGGSDGTVRFSTRHGDPGRVFQDFDNAVGHLRWSHSGLWLAATSGDQNLRLYHPQRGAGPSMGNQSAIGGISWSPNDSIVACGLRGLTGIQFWFAATKFRSFEMIPGGTPAGLRDHVQAMDFHPTEKRLAAGAAYGTLALFDLDPQSWTLKPLIKSSEPAAWLHTGSMSRVAWSHHGDRLASADGHGIVGLWTNRGRYVGQLRTGGSGVVDLAWSADDRWLAAGDAAGTVWIWDFSSNEGRVMAGLLGSVSSLDWHGSQNWLVVSTASGMIRRFDATTGNVVLTSLLRPDGQQSLFNSAGQVVSSNHVELSQHFLHRNTAASGAVSVTELSTAELDP